MYRIFHGKHLIVLTTIDSQKHKKDADFVYKSPSEEQILEVLKVSKNSTKPLKIVLRGNPKKLINRVFMEFKYIPAAGGVVEKNDGEILLMKRLGKWDLPKGKQDKGEDIETCALREIEEETGAKDLSIVSHLKDTYHTYYRKEKWVLKHTYWYIVDCKNATSLAPQTSEGIEKLKWKQPLNIDMEMLNTYPAIKYVLKKYLKIIKAES